MAQIGVILVRESWAALYEYFGGLTAERLEGLALRVAQEIQRAFPTLAEADTCMMDIIDNIMPQEPPVQEKSMPPSMPIPLLQRGPSADVQDVTEVPTAKRVLCPECP